jgi:hypothetical protein
MAVTEIKELKATPRPASAEPAPLPPMRSGPEHTFKPLTDTLATRSVVLSVLGLILFVFPVVSFLGAIGGALSLRRIKRSNGTLVGEGTARLALWLGIAGVIIGGGAIALYLLLRN